MSPQSPSQKRKRGRPSQHSKIASHHTSTSQPPAGPNAEEEREETDPRPRKRGRRAEKQNTEAPDTAIDAPPDRPGGRKRGRPSARDAAPGQLSRVSNAQHEPGQDGDENPVQPRRSKRDRSSLEGAKPWWEVGGSANTSLVEAAPKGPTPQQPKKRGRPSLADVSVDEAQNKGKRGRPSRSNDKEDDAPARKRRGRPSLADQEVQEIPVSHTKRRGRPPTSKEPQHEVARPDSIVEEAASSEEHHRKRGRKIQRHQAQDSLSDEVEQPGASQVRQLIPRTRHIPRATIATKWAALEPAAISLIGNLLGEAERPVLLRLRDSQNRREHARAAVSIVSRRVRSKLSKGMPFPPSSTKARTTVAGVKSGQEDDLDFERVVDTMQALERTLSPLLHSVALLSQEKEREEQGLEQDYATLRTLEANARSEARSWRERRKRAHPLAPEAPLSGADADSSPDRRTAKHPSETAAAGLFKVRDHGMFSYDLILTMSEQDLQGDELLSLSKQLASHMDSMKTNLQQIGGVAPAVLSSRAALQQVLHKHLDPQHYERVLLG
ncbi:uncharacterized protein E0L32_008854 [Thyridium curvatum]|uniref:Kinetochore protein fta7 n=1 Tax=Thyridium curvatum TaxID=1093900 RepID=A0A507ARD1_9PEZI|nr:uncharacterized protein E0L32_008854 [Thyridium curvatum]TPX10007.1 hypothetical protein E0L32_008854 [Thyridium curvatum]